MRPDLLDYAQPDTKSFASAAARVSPRRSRWFVFIAQTFALSLIAVPIGALTIPLLNHPYGLVGAAVCVGSGVGVLNLSPSHWHRRLLLAAVVAAVATTVALHVISINTYVLENASGQVIRHISWHPLERNYSFAFNNVPQRAVLSFRVHDLFYDGRGNVASGELADGGQLHSAAWEISGTRYRRNTKIRIEPGGHVNVAWP